MVPHVFNPSTWKGEAGRSLGSRLSRATKKKNIQMKMVWCCFFTYTSSMCFSFQTAIHSCPVLIYRHFLYFICLFFLLLCFINNSGGLGKRLSQYSTSHTNTGLIAAHPVSRIPNVNCSLHMHVLHTDRYSYVFHLIFEGQGQGWAV